MGAVACVPDRPPVPPSPEAQLYADVRAAYENTLRNVVVRETPWGASATDSLLRAATSSSHDTPADRIGQWFAAAQAYDTVWAGVSAYERILERGLVVGQGAPWQPLLVAVVEANTRMRATERDLVRIIAEFQAAPALTRYRSGPGALGARTDDLRRDGELMLWIGRLDVAWRAWEAQLLARARAVDRFLYR
jgi:hypothetical protein